MTSLAREAYSDTGADLTELTTRFDTSDEIRADLFDLAVPTAYRRPGTGRAWTQAQAVRRLIELAGLLDRAGTYELSWWRLPAVGPRWIAAAGGGIVAGTATLALSAVVVHSLGPLIALVALGTGVGAFLGWRQPPVPSTVHWSLAGGFERLWRSVRPTWRPGPLLTFSA